MGYKIEVTPLASEDLDEIVTYIAQELENPTAAAAFLDEVDACYEGLETMPFRTRQKEVNPLSIQFVIGESTPCHRLIHFSMVLATGFYNLFFEKVWFQHDVFGGNLTA